MLPSTKSIVYFCYKIALRRSSIYLTLCSETLCCCYFFGLLFLFLFFFQLQTYIWINVPYLWCPRWIKFTSSFVYRPRFVLFACIVAFHWIIESKEPLMYRFSFGPWSWVRNFTEVVPLTKIVIIVPQQHITCNFMTKRRKFGTDGVL